VNLTTDQMVIGFTYHIFPQVAKNKADIVALLAPLINDPRWGGVQVPPLSDAEVAAALGSALKIAGVTAVYGVGQSLTRAGLDLHAVDETVRKASVEKVKHYIDEAYLMGARMMDLNPGKDPGPDLRPKAKEAAISSLTELCEYAQSKATDYVLPLSMENFDRDVDKKFFLGPTIDTIEVISAVRERCSNMGITLDIAHLLIMQEDPAESVQAAGDMIFHCHLANFIIEDRDDPRWGDQHPPFMVKGSEVHAHHLARYLGALKEVGYFDAKPEEFRKRLVTFEIRPGAGEPTERVMAGSMRILREAITQVG